MVAQVSRHDSAHTNTQPFLLVLTIIIGIFFLEFKSHVIFIGVVYYPGYLLYQASIFGSQTGVLFVGFICWFLWVH
jgi:hypothetical protein